MSYDRKAIWLCLGLVVSAIGGAGSASAQYNRGYDRDPDYDRRERYERRDRYDRRDGYRRDDRGGYDRRARGYDQGAGPGRGNNNPRGTQQDLIRRGLLGQ
ncbi:hypothetical protein [Bosea vaviloviae]|uniref:hypothetical protein n=1 Tax=Bosea vaviloviae TaxID=1526658 RepID=UPI0011DF1E34|nr:hypothetical protein [Bosea vaviloviae]